MVCDGTRWLAVSNEHLGFALWLVVALPVQLHAVFGWDFWKVGGFMATWVISSDLGANDREILQACDLGHQWTGVLSLRVPELK